MSFGIGIGDFIAIGDLSWKVYKACKDASASFENISTEVLSLHAILTQVKEVVLESGLTESQITTLAVIKKGCRRVLTDLKSLVRKYRKLGSNTQRTWDRMKWHAEDLVEYRLRLITNTVLLSTFLSTTQHVVERKLEKLLQEFRDGQHEGSVITRATLQSLTPDDKETWRAIRKELEDIGITVTAFNANKDGIIEWFQSAFENGALEEEGKGSDGNLGDSSSGEDDEDISSGDDGSKGSEEDEEDEIPREEEEDESSAEDEEDDSSGEDEKDSYASYISREGRNDIVKPCSRANTRSIFWPAKNKNSSTSTRPTPFRDHKQGNSQEKLFRTEVVKDQNFLAEMSGALTPADEYRHRRRRKSARKYVDGSPEDIQGGKRAPEENQEKKRVKPIASRLASEKKIRASSLVNVREPHYQQAPQYQQSPPQQLPHQQAGGRTKSASQRPLTRVKKTRSEETPGLSGWWAR